jgi:hypothetical protein
VTSVTSGSPLLTPREAADYLRVKTLKTLRRLGVKRVRYNDRTFRYRLEDLETFLKARAS